MKKLLSAVLPASFLAPSAFAQEAADPVTEVFALVDLQSLQTNQIVLLTVAATVVVGFVAFRLLRKGANNCA